MDTDSAYPSNSLRLIAKALAGFVGLIVLLWSIRPLFQSLIDYMLISNFWNDLPTGAKFACFLLTGIILTSLGFPRQSVALLGGYLFGMTLGCLLAMVATLGGCMLAYHIAAQLGSVRIRRFMPPGLPGSIEGWTREQVFVKTLMIRLMPVGSNLATNITAGIVRAPRLQFFTASLIGFLPQILIFVIGGSSVSSGSTVQFFIGSGLFVISLALGFRLYVGGHLTGNASV